VHKAVIDWLLDSDPALRWQVLRDLLDEPQAVWESERALVESEGLGARLLAAQDPDGLWAGGAFVPKDFSPELWRSEGQPWTATCFALTQLRDFGLPPDSIAARRTVLAVGANARWDEGGRPYWQGEVEECVNARVVADGAYFGAEIRPLVERLLSEQQPDGGWNCERANGSLRSSFATTLQVLEGFLHYVQRYGGDPAVAKASGAGEEFLLERQLFLGLRSGQPADPRFLELLYPNRWRYDILRALDHFRASSQATRVRPDPRLRLAIDLLRKKARPDGTWALDWQPKGRVWFELDEGPGKPSRWLTLRALRVLRWWESA
jgi:hypothetical protein